MQWLMMYGKIVRKRNKHIAEMFGEFDIESFRDGKRRGKITMTTKELCEVFSKEIGKSFELSKDEIIEQLFVGTTAEMTTEEVFAKMILNSIIISANLSAQTIINGLVIMGIIPKDVLDQAKLKPNIHLVKTLYEPDDVECKAEKKIKTIKRPQKNSDGKIDC